MHSNVRGRYKTALETCCQVGFFGGTFRSQTLHVFSSSGSGSSCTKGMEMEEEACNSSDCPCELEETEWTEWSDCTVACGDSGTGTRC